MPRVVHFEFQATEPEVLVRFYTKLFGWTIKRWGDVPYWLVEAGTDTRPGINGGLLLRRGPPPADGQSVKATDAR